MTAIGLYTQALIDTLAATSRLAQPNTALLEKIAAHEMPAGVRGLLEACAHHGGSASIGFLTLGASCIHQEIDAWDEEERLLCIGNYGDGDLLALVWPPKPDGRVVDLLHSGGFRLADAGPLEAFLEKRVQACHDGEDEDKSRRTDLDPALANLLRRRTLEDDWDYKEARKAAREAARDRHRIVAMPERGLPAPPPGDEAERLLPGKPRSALFVAGDRERLFLVDDAGARTEVARPETSRAAWLPRASMSPDGSRLVAGSPMLLRTISTATGEARPLLQGAGYEETAQLADGLAVVRQGQTSLTFRRDEDEADVVALAQARGVAVGALRIDTAPMVWIVDCQAGEGGKVVLQRLAVDCDRLCSALEGRILVLCRDRLEGAEERPEWQTAILGVTQRRVVLLGRLRENVGAPTGVLGKDLTTAHGYRLKNVASALAHAEDAPAVTRIADTLDAPEDEE